MRMNTADRIGNPAHHSSVFFRQGYFGKRVTACRSLWLWSAVLALLCMLISYPGIWYSDSYVRVATGGAILNSIVKTLTGHRFPLNTDNAFTVIPSFFIAFSQGLTGHVGLYTFLQAFAFFAATFLLIRELNPAHRRIQSVLFAVSPLIYGVSVYYEAGIGCVSGMVCLILLFRRAGEPQSRGDRALALLLVFFASFVTFGYRTNALTVLPVLVFFLIRQKKEKLRKCLILFALILGILFTKALPWIFDIHSQSTASVGIVWEMLTVIQRMPQEEQAAYRDYLDDIGGEGSTRAALAASSEDSAGSFMWGKNLGTEALSAPGATTAALKKYVRLILEKPTLWLRVKADFIRKSLGIGYALDNSEYNYDRWDEMKNHGMVDSLQRQAFYRSFMLACSLLGFYLMHPWVPFLVSAVLLAAEYLRKSPRRGRYAFVFWMAVFYELAYLLDTPAFDFRYFYPSCFLLMLLDAAISLDWIARALRRPCGKRKSGV